MTAHGFLALFEARSFKINGVQIMGIQSSLALEVKVTLFQFVSE